MIDRKGTLSLLVLTAVAGLATPAFAQETAPAATEPAPVTHHRTSNGSGGFLGGSGPGFGLGATAFLGGPFGPEAVYDFGGWHLEALLGFVRTPANGAPGSNSSLLLNFGVGGWYHLNMGDSSDFSLGGTIGFSHTSVGDNSNSAVTIDPGAMIRAFVTPNVAVFGRMAFVLSFDNAGPINEQFSLLGNVMGGFGMTYFFR